MFYAVVAAESDSVTHAANPSPTAEPTITAQPVCAWL